MPVNQFAKISPIVDSKGFLLSKTDTGTYKNRVIVNESAIDEYDKYLHLKENEIGICLENNALITIGFNDYGKKEVIIFKEHTNQRNFVIKNILDTDSHENEFGDFEYDYPGKFMRNIDTSYSELQNKPYKINHIDIITNSYPIEDYDDHEFGSCYSRYYNRANLDISKIGQNTITNKNGDVYILISDFYNNTEKILLDDLYFSSNNNIEIKSSRVLINKNFYGTLKAEIYIGETLIYGAWDNNIWGDKNNKVTIDLGINYSFDE